MRPRRYLERNRDCVRAGFAPGRPPPVHPRPTGACAAMRGFQICVSEPRANAKAALGMARAPSFFTMSNSPLRGLVPRSTSLSRDAFLRPGWSRSIRARPEEGWAERRQAHYFVCRVCETRRSARVRRGASHDAGRSPLGAPPWRFSAGGRASISGIASGSVQRSSSQPGHHAWRAVSRTSRARGYEPRPQDATPRSAFQDRLRKTPLHERGWESLYYKFVT